MTSHIKNKRPNCEDILEDKESWALSLHELDCDKDLAKSTGLSAKFHLRYIGAKFKFKK